MFDGQTPHILVNQSKGRAGNHIACAQGFDKPSGKGGLSHTHTSKKGDHFTPAQGFRQPGRKPGRLFRRMGKIYLRFHQNNPWMTLFSSTSIFSAEGTLGRPGIVIMSPA